MCSSAMIVMVMVAVVLVMVIGDGGYGGADECFESRAGGEGAVAGGFADA